MARRGWPAVEFVDTGFVSARSADLIESLPSPTIPIPILRYFNPSAQASGSAGSPVAGLAPALLQRDMPDGHLSSRLSKGPGTRAVKDDITERLGKQLTSVHLFERRMI
jgi:hypothetical protein